MALFIAIFLILGIALTVLAAMPPDALRAAQEAAPEQARIEVTKVIHHLEAPEEGTRWVHIEVTANVLAVHRTRRGLKPGDTILIRWTLHSPRNRAVGDFPTPVEVDREYEACLDGDVHGFLPAAYSMSFEPMPWRARA